MLVGRNGTITFPNGLINQPGLLIKDFCTEKYKMFFYVLKKQDKNVKKAFK